MASLNSDKVEKNFIKKGFSKYNNDHRYLEFIHNGKFIAKTKISHNGQDIGDNLISLMSNQCKMSKPFFKDFAKCEKSKEDYIKELQVNKII